MSDINIKMELIKLVKLTGGSYAVYICTHTRRNPEL